MMHERGKSDIAIVAVKPANVAERSGTELVEPRAVTKGNADQQPTCRTQSRAAAKTAQVCVSQELECYGKTHTAFRRSTFGKSRMRESCTSGSVRGARGNSRPYRDQQARSLRAFAKPIASIALPQERWWVSPCRA